MPPCRCHTRQLGSLRALRSSLSQVLPAALCLVVLRAAWLQWLSRFGTTAPIGWARPHPWIQTTRAAECKYYKQRQFYGSIFLVKQHESARSLPFWANSTSGEVEERDKLKGVLELCGEFWSLHRVGKVSTCFRGLWTEALGIAVGSAGGKQKRDGVPCMSALREALWDLIKAYFKAGF